MRGRHRITVLVTGTGAPGTAGTLYCLRENGTGREVRVVCVDIREEVEGKYLGDAFYQVLPPESPGYIPGLLKIVDAEKVDVILPQTTREVAVLSRKLEFFEGHCAVAVSSAESVAVANDKHRLLLRAGRLGVPCPRWSLVGTWSDLEAAVEALGYPGRKVVVKPQVSHGGRGLRILTEDVESIKSFFGEKPSGVEVRLSDLERVLGKGHWPTDMLIQEFLPGQEWTVDVFRGRAGCVAIPRVREEIRSGITMRATVYLQEDLLKWSRMLAADLNLKFAFGFQFRGNKDGDLRLLEANPRIQGGMIVAEAAGFNVIWASVLELLAEEVEIDSAGLREVSMRRYWGAICCDDDEVVEFV